MAQELSYKLDADRDGVTTFDSGKAVVARVAEWLDTPQGQVWGAPDWGNPLQQYKHLPMNNTVAGAMELSIANKLPEDLPDVAINAILVEPLNIDQWRIAISVGSVNDAIERSIKL